MSENINKKPSSVILDNRKKLCITGAEDVPGFNEETVNVYTTLGDLIVRGSSLHINKLNLDSGEVEIEGIINSLQYTESKSSKSFIQRLFS
ncbi:MAG: sporulation protein YabP [Ruminococcus sp.]|nr:sporulation protein YabP [Ruminococcus sp.]